MISFWISSLIISHFSDFSENFFHALDWLGGMGGVVGVATIPGLDFFLFLIWISYSFYHFPYFFRPNFFQYLIVHGAFDWLGGMGGVVGVATIPGLDFFLIFF